MSIQQNNDSIIDELRLECQNYLLEIAKKDREINRLSAHIDEMKIQLASRQGTGALLRQVYNDVDNKIMKTINERGAISEKKKKHPVMNIDINDAHTLLNEINNYDRNEFFSYKQNVRSSHLKPHYRLAAKLYRTARDGVRSAATGARRRLSRGDNI